MKLDLKIYRGYANKEAITINGHVFKKHAPDIFKLDQRWYKHALAVFQIFTIKTVSNAQVTFTYNNTTLTTLTNSNGEFTIHLPYHLPIESGWHTCTITALYLQTTITKQGEFVKPYPGEYGIISDIDDTFLVSYSGNFFKKLYVLLTQNINKRKVFKDVVAHYKLLNYLGRQTNATNNAFFFVSSSEWNLYDFITRFTAIHQLPKAVLALKNIKSGIVDFLFTGGGNHNHKFYKIKELITFYPELRFVLLGDDSQKDPEIYESICKMFPNNISTVYIRQTNKHAKTSVNTTIQRIADLEIKTCYFKHSTTAIAHTKKYLG